MSMSIKLMGVPGPKLLDDEQYTQDMLGVSTPTFVTPDTRAERAACSTGACKNAAIFYFLNPRDSHILDSIMQLLWTKTQTSPLEGQYFSCVPYLLGEGQAMQYSLLSRRKKRTPRAAAAAAARRTTTCATRWSKTLAEEDVEFDFTLQVQTDPLLMPIENNAVLWPTKLSPRVPAAVLRIPKQTFDSPAQLDFARVLTYNPWHSHRRAPPARQPEPRAQADVLELVAAAPGDERRSSTTSRRATRTFPGSTPIPAR